MSMLLNYSSDDDISNMMDGTPKQKRHIRRRSIGVPSDSSEDEFEKEMMSELDSQMTITYSIGQAASQSNKEKGLLLTRFAFVSKDL